MEQYFQNPICPVCNAQNTNVFLSLNDYFLTKELFQIIQCRECQLKFTWPRPDETAIGQYYKSDDYLSHGKSNNTLTGWVYNLVKKRALKKKFAIATHTKKNKGTILDIGCGTGAFVHFCAQQGWNAVGIEPDDEARNLATPHPNLELGNEKKLYEYKPESFDIITLWHVLEHVYHLNQRIEIINRLLKPDGRLIIAVPNHESYDAKYYKQHWAAWDVPRHLYHFSKESLTKLMQQNHFLCETILPMKMDSYYVSLLSEKYKKNKITYIKAAYIGWLSNRKSIKSNNTSSLIFVFEKIKPNKAL